MQKEKAKSKMDTWDSRLSRMLATVRDYSQVSSIHGLRHVVKVGVSLKERLFWVALVLACGAELISICLNQWDTYRRIPTETVLTDPAGKILGRLFPCVGLCPLHQMDRRVALRLLRQATAEANRSLHGAIPSAGDGEELPETGPYVSEDDLHGLLLALHKLVATGMQSALPLFHKHNDAILHLDNHVNVVDFMKRVFPTCHNFFHSCLWRGMPFDCCKHFILKATEQGFCYFFRAAEANKMVCAEAFPDHEDQKARCLADQRLTRYGPGSGLRVYLNTHADPDTVVDESLTEQLARVTIREQCVATRMQWEGVVGAAPAGAYALMLTDVRTDVSDDLGNMSPEERGCYYDHEWPGSTPQNRKNFPEHYNQLECIVRCRRQYVLEVCKCLPYPFTLNDPNTACLLSKTQECITNTSDWISFFRAADGTPGFSPNEYLRGVPCPSCPPRCIASRFTLDTRTPVTHGELTAGPAALHGVARLAQRTQLDIFFPGPNAAVLYTVMRTYSGSNLLVTFGGVANLFLGISFITLLELIVLVGKCAWILLIQPMWARRRTARLTVA